jgi:hypothetical protein
MTINDTAILRALALIDALDDPKKLTAMRENAEKLGIEVVIVAIRDKQTALTAAAGADPIVPGFWNEVIGPVETITGKRRQRTRNAIAAAVAEGKETERQAIVRLLSQWAFSPNPTIGFDALLKANRLDASGEAFIVRNAGYFGADVVLAAKARLKEQGYQA